MPSKGYKYPPEVITARVAKIVATKLAKRIPKICPGCQKPFTVKPSQHWRKFCSNKCAGNAIHKHRVSKCASCGTEFAVNWKNRRNKTCSEDCAHAEISRRQKEAGYSPAANRDYEKWKAVVQSPEHAKNLSKAITGRVYTTDLSRRWSPQHSRAKEAFFRDPAGRIHYAQNITAFVKNHEHLFNPEDVVWKDVRRSLSCRATQGLISLQRNVETRLSWKGWTLVSKREGADAVDYINRQPRMENPIRI